jgi:hypothetical protein
MNPSRFPHQLPDPDAGEVQEWADSLDALTEVRGTARASRGTRHRASTCVADAVCRYGIDPDGSDPRDA